MISNDRSTSRKFTQNFDAGGCKLIFDNQRNGTEDNYDNKKAVMLDEREATYRSEDASNFLNSKTVMIIIPAYGVYISQLVRYARICTSKVDFMNRLWGLSLRLRQQGFVTNHLINSLIGMVYRCEV